MNTFSDEFKTSIPSALDSSLFKELSWFSIGKKDNWFFVRINFILKNKVSLVLFTKYLVPFEVAAVMLLVAMIGGIILAGKKMDVSITQMSEQEVDKHKTDTEIEKDVK